MNSSTDDIRIGVINHGRGPNGNPNRKVFEPAWAYGGVFFTYEVSEPGKKPVYTVLPWVVAREHWGLTLDSEGKLIRATEPEGDEDESLFEARLSSLCPKLHANEDGSVPWRKEYGAGMFIDDPDYIDWFTNGVQFKMKRISVRQYAEEFAR